MLGFDITQWEEIINSEKLLMKNSSILVLSNNDCDADKQDVIKVSVSYKKFLFNIFVVFFF